MTFFDANVHILLAFGKDAANSRGKKACVPSIKGISGCGVWRIAGPIGKDLAKRSTEEIRLVALQHRRIETKGNRQYVQGTWIRYVLGLILDNYPEMRAAMSLVYPRGILL